MHLSSSNNLEDKIFPNSSAFINTYINRIGVIKSTDSLYITNCITYASQKSLQTSSTPVIPPSISFEEDSYDVVSFMLFLMGTYGNLSSNLLNLITQLVKTTTTYQQGKMESLEVTLRALFNRPHRDRHDVPVDTEHIHQLLAAINQARRLAVQKVSMTLLFSRLPLFLSDVYQNLSYVFGQQYVFTHNQFQSMASQSDDEYNQTETHFDNLVCSSLLHHCHLLQQLMITTVEVVHRGKRTGRRAEPDTDASPLLALPNERMTGHDEAVNKMNEIEENLPPLMISVLFVGMAIKTDHVYIHSNIYTLAYL